MFGLKKLSVGQEAYYLDEIVEGAEDYYVNAGEAPGRWLGAGSRRIGLVGQVAAEDLHSVLAGNNPAGGELLRVTRVLVPAFDLCLSAPKGVSLPWGLGNRKTRRAVERCHDHAVEAAITYFERHACRVRRGHAGEVTEPGGGFVAAAFRHRTSRSLDPALHTHVLVANMTEGPDGRWTALDTRLLYLHGRTAGFVYQAVLRYELARTLGFLFDDVEQGYAEVVGIPEDMRREFSERRRQILDQLEHHGASSAQAAQVAALETRRAKVKDVSEEEMRRRWAERAAPFGVDVDRLPSLVRTPVVDQADEDIAASVTEANATFERRDVVRAVAEGATQGASLEDIEARTDAFLASEQAVSIAPELWTTPEILELESRTVELAQGGIDTGRGVADSDAVDASISARPTLGAEQVRAIRAITSSGNAVDLLLGHAGAGKTIGLDAAREAWEASGYRVLGVALAARAAAQLETSAAIPSQTADRLLNGIRRGRVRLDDHTVIAVDESGMLGTRRLAALVAEADAAGAKVVLVGDPKQLPEIDAGGLFAGLAKRLGYSELKRNRRQRDIQEVAAAHELRLGQVERAMERLQRNGNVTTAANADLLRDGLVGDWYQARLAGHDVAMAAGRRAQIADLNERAREVRRAAAELGEDVLETDELAFAIGDEVIAHKNRYDLGLLNGDRGVVRCATERGLTIDLADGRQLEVPVAYIDEGNLTHGYATTVHKAQGMTCDRVFVLGDDTFTVEQAYTGMTRARDRNQLYLVAPSRDDGHGRSPEIDPLASFTSALHRSGAKTAAIDLIQPTDGGQ